MQNILVVNVNWLGDVIFSSPVFTAIKENYPQARVSCLAVPRVKEILESIPAIDEIIIYDERGIHRSPFAKLRLIADLRRRKFDIAFLLHGSLTRALLVFFAGIPKRVGYSTKNRGPWLTHVVQELPEGVHRSDHYLNVIQSFIKVRDRRCQLKVSSQARQEIDAMLQAQGVGADDPVVVVNIGGNWNLKRWPPVHFRQLIEKLTQERGFKIVVPGGAQDRPAAETIRGASPLNPVVLAGQTNLPQLIALMQRASLVVSADSGPLHIASAVGTPTIGLFGPTRPEMTGPRGQGRTQIFQKDVGCNRGPCYYLECPDNVCMKSISVNEVFVAIKQVM